jgi:uncharacterized metal-binding protein
MLEKLPNCALCPIKKPERACKDPDGKYPPECPTINLPTIRDAAMKEYQQPEIHEFARQASIQETQGYGDKQLGYSRARPVKPRIEEIIDFARKMSYRRLGLVFCSGLMKEARIVGQFFKDHGFELVSVICKVGCVPKESIGLKEDEKNSPGNFESMCNPIMQAMVFNEAEIDFIILLGLCVGHDSLFFKYAKAPCTVLAVKDRLLGHNPMAAVYNLDHYYRYLKP